MLVSLNEKKIYRREKTHVPICSLSSHLPQLAVLSNTVCSENIREKIKSLVCDLFVNLYKNTSI